MSTHGGNTLGDLSCINVFAQTQAIPSKSVCGLLVQSQCTHHACTRPALGTRGLQWMKNQILSITRIPMASSRTKWLVVTYHKAAYFGCCLHIFWILRNLRAQQEVGGG